MYIGTSFLSSLDEPMDVGGGHPGDNYDADNDDHNSNNMIT